ncbi:MAG: glycosyltransferase [Chitinophagaceae bacterium]|nr:glycosyltransferase [Chitinophagaceae bacterium]
MNSKKILVLNNYSLKRVTEEIRLNVKPSHHLYGIMEMKSEGIIFDYLETDTTHFLFKLGKWMRKIPLFYLGDLYIQVKALKQQNNYDVIYAPCQDCTIFLGLLRYFKILRTPLVAIAHHPILSGRLISVRRLTSYFFLKGHSFFPALSNVVATQINSIVGKELSAELHWGPNLAFYEKELSLQEKTLSKDIDIVAIGRTGRDYDTLIRAFDGTNIRVAIYCHESCKNSLLTKFTNNISIHFLQNPEELNYKRIIQIYSNSKILAIPMLPQDSLCGLTSVVDGIAMGMPIIATYNKYINIDIEKLRIGYWVKPYDENEWRQKTMSLLNNADLIKSMSDNALRVGKEKININLFTDEIKKLLVFAV